MPGTVIVLGTAPLEDRILPGVAREYGWSLKRVRDVRSLQNISEQYEIVAVLFQADESQMTPGDMIGAIRAAAPGARPILCHRFADSIPWPAMAAAGAFHSLLVPFAVPEVRQSFGFVWAGQGIAEPASRVKTRKSAA